MGRFFGISDTNRFRWVDRPVGGGPYLPTPLLPVLLTNRETLPKYVLLALISTTRASVSYRDL